MPQWAEYRVTFHTNGRGEDIRYVRAISERDARYRVARKYIMPALAEIVRVERISI